MTSYTYNPSKPKTAANYPLIGNPYHHYYTTRNKRILMAVQHITAGSSDFDGVDSSAEATLNYSSSTATKASYHGIVDSDTIRDCLPDDYTAWAQGVTGHNFNSPALSQELGLKSPDWTKAPADWVDKVIRNSAKWWAPRVKKYGIPLVVQIDRAKIDQLIAADKMVGFTEHHTLDPTRRSDAGYITATKTTFPWPLLFKYIKEELGQPSTEKEWFEMALDATTKQEITDAAGRAFAADVIPSPMFAPDNPTMARDTALRYTAEWALQSRNAAQEALKAVAGVDAKVTGLTAAFTQFVQAGGNSDDLAKLTTAVETAVDKALADNVIIQGDVTVTQKETTP